MVPNIQELIAQMTLEEKAGLCSGLDFWQTKAVERLGIPSIMMTDGPHGLRKQKAGNDHLGIFDSVPSTCFPAGAGMACSWDRELIKQVGAAIGEECQAEDVSILLGPGANIKRSPLCGRNFEYFSEDPYLSSEMAVGHIEGVQSQGVGTSLKHFAANNQEHRRMSVDAIVDERTLREIYLASFESVVKKAQPWTVMCSYNQVNGEYASENPYLLTDILKEEWGHEGFVVSDWGAVNERAKGLAAGLELEMPSSNGAGDQKIIDAVRSGTLSEAALDRAVGRLLSIISKAVENRKENASYDLEAHHQLARVAARESMVLLKNEGGLLPLKREGSYAVIGDFARNPRYQGGGSSHIKPTRLDDIFNSLQEEAGSSANLTYAQGYTSDSDEPSLELIEQAIEAASQVDTAIVFVGLPERYESEGYDRTHLRIPESQICLIEAVAKVQSNVVVVLSNGSPIEMPWISNVKAVLEGYLGGQALGGAISDLLFGKVSPSGKLAETFPMQLEHNPSYLNFPGEGDTVEYKEGLFVGYRYYDAKRITPLFPFGYGLSYTTFAYSDLSVSTHSLKDTDTLQVSVKVTNTGAMQGKEIVQLYVKDVLSNVVRPDKELKGFAKVDLLPGETKLLSFTLDSRAFAYYNVELRDWHVETGEFEILVGPSSQALVFAERVVVESTVILPKSYTRNSTIGDLMGDPQGAAIIQSMLSQAGGMMSMMQDGSDMMMAMMRYMPLRALVAFSQGAMSEQGLDELIVHLNSNK
ncbi:glycoside hydrolase family 3 C-terminal domain-containing protein [Paenibacillus sp. G2S3]|uniref:beta-glucosidase family protein n=1 Tax=Paenibacillus sp. G2S3 TaxID=3047872 RepID=UPI0024C115B7|nr:glycoside hydrolase family 3 C-terminal domain-containing protein [Paenibacillus sp. G2S3]WHY17608.1 glycoside hydrolase family 3 C-terminal domain-containing protein [Paenibacillus sp. G2S3]